MTGTFIVIDGPDASGSTLHARLLAERLRKEGREVLVTAEPTEGPVGLWIRELLKEKKVPSSTLQILFTADRAWHVEQVILPALREGKTVISDRYSHSTVAYGMALGLDSDWLKEMNRSFPKPDATVFTLPPIRTCMERLSRREKQDFLEQRDLQEGVHAAYRKIAEQDPAIVVVDTSGEKGDVSTFLWNALRKVQS
ncbi:MAG: dTMP kinase [Candidatus Peribacteraceae bacterium]